MMMIKKNRITLITMIILVLLSFTMSLKSKNEKNEKITKTLKTKKASSFSKNQNQIKSNATTVTQTTSTTTDGKGTDVFVGHSDATNAAGVVGNDDYTITKAPYEVQSCDQVLQISGKTINLKDYSDRKPAFMTLSIYFANFFPSKNSSALIESMETQTLTSGLTQLPGAPGCTMFHGPSKHYSFCFESEEIREQIEIAARKFLNCKNEDINDLHLQNALKGCDLSKVDLGKQGPFGKYGKKIHKIMEKMKKKDHDKKDNYKGVNPYYIKKGIPGDYEKISKA